MNKINIYNLLQECKVESDVEEKYKRVMNNYFPDAKISSPYYTDGLLENGVKMLMEFKYNFDLTKRLKLVDLLIQLIYYLKDFEQHGDELPSIIFGGDFDECFCLHSNDVISYLNEDIDWSINASSAPSKNPDLAKKLYNDQNIKPYIFSINDDRFDFQFVVDKIKQLHAGSVQKLRITELNINRFFSYFEDKIIKQKKKYDSETLVSIFLGCLIESNNNYPHPKKKNLLVSTSGEVAINRSLFDAFFDHFETSYSIEEKKQLTAICDRLIDDEARRFRGEFYTPTEWVLEAHKMIEDQFGLNWKEEYVVWDPAWGTGNLTRDFKFKELYCSTINYGDLQIGKHYNPEAMKFQYDFLNDDIIPDLMIPIESSKKIPASFHPIFYPKKDKDGNELIKNLLFYFNPPFGTASNFNFSGNNKDSISKTKINNEMLSYESLGKSAEQLYSQFLYRIMKFKRTSLNRNIFLSFFSPTLFLTGSSFKKFRQSFLNEFCFEKGFVFCSKHFSNTSSAWSVMFSIWSPRKNTNKFIVKVKNFKEDRTIETRGLKELYNTDRVIAANKWAKEKIKGIKRYDYPHLSNPLSIKEHGGGTWCDNAIGYFCNATNNVMCNTKQVSLFSSADTLFHGFPFINRNFYEVISLFTARKTIIPNWINQKDEYLAPNEKHEEYPQWNTDAIIYSLFNGASNQSSLRKITYKDKIWDIKNEWFWMSNKQMLQLANKNGFDDLHSDAIGDHDRFVFNKIQESSFSEDAAAVLNKAIELTIKTFTYREQLHEEYPEWHLNTWDAGWYQIKLILKKYFKDDLKEFNLLYKEFENRMREGVYKFEFLK